MEDLETSSPDLLLLAVGDVHMDREDPESALALAAPVLGAADVLFGNCEGVYTDGRVRAPSAGIPVVSARCGGQAPRDVVVQIGCEGFVNALRHRTWSG